MGLLHKLPYFGNLFGKKSYQELEAIINRTKGGTFKSLKTNRKDQLGEYSSWVYSCVSLISDRVSTLPFEFYDKRDKSKLSPKSKGYASFTKPFLNPNPIMSLRFIKAFCQIQFELCGMACIYKSVNRLGQVWELWPLNMNDLFDIKVNNSDLTNPSVKYIFHIDNREFVFDQSELLILHNPNPNSQFMPMSPIQAQAYSVDIEKYVEVYERDFFKNSARIDMALMTDEDLTPTKAEEIKQRWKAKFSGVFHDVAVLDKGLTPIPLKFTNKDFEFLNLAGWTKEKIIGAYRVPVSKLGSSDINRSGAVIADIAFNREAIQPKMVLWDEEFNSGILSTFNPNVEIRHTNPIPRDRELEVKEARTFLGGVPCKTINEFREFMNDPPVDHGDEILIPSGWMRLSDIGKAINSDDPNSGNDSATDPLRHDDDEPHLNPDGSDDRDESPTEGRSFDDFHSLELSARGVWNKHLALIVLGSTKDNIEKTSYVGFDYLVEMTTGTLLKYFGSEGLKINKSDWINPIAKTAAKEIKQTLLSNPKCEVDEWSCYVKDQFDQNIRISKIVNSMIKATINYAKNCVIESKGLKKVWIVGGNECGHRGKVKSFESLDTFEVAATKMKFPCQLTGKLNFTCDCTITTDQKEK